MNGTEGIGLPWVVTLGFLRLTTSPRVFSQPLSPAAAWDVVEEWFASSVCRPLAPGSRHREILKTLVLEHGTAGNLTTDAHLAAICIEHGATLYTADNDFGRFPALKWKNPLS
jgi:hypothetical protein